MAKTVSDRGKEKAGGKTGDARREKKEEDTSVKSMLLITIPLLAAFIVFFAFVLPMLSVPFSTFKSNFLSAQRVAVLAQYGNSAGSGSVLQCATQVVQIIAHSRNASSIDFYVLNGTSCTYPVGGLGHTVTLSTNSTQNCINMTRSEPSLFLNYSATNSTLITTSRLYISGNEAYMSSCPIAVDLS